MALEQDSAEADSVHESGLRSTAPSADSPLAVGQQLGGYTIQREVARGGFAVVYEATTADGEKRAIKVLNNIPGRVNEDVIHRFKMEIVLLSHIDHVHVVHFYEASAVPTKNNKPMLWVALEFLEGPTLRQLIHENPAGIFPEKIARWGKQIADGLDDAHSLKVIHRDLKPENISIVHGIAKIFDFGIAKFYDWGVKTTEHSKRFGTLPYMAPEQLQPGEVDGRVDVYALGLILHELATGRHAYLNAGEQLSEVSAPAIMMRSLVEDPAPLTDLIDGFPTELSAVVARALQKERAHRFPTMTQMLDGLDGALRAIKESARHAVLADAYIALEPGVAPPSSGRSDEEQVTSSGMRVVATARRDSTPADVTSLREQKHTVRIGDELDRVPNSPTPERQPAELSRRRERPDSRVAPSSSNLRDAPTLPPSSNDRPGTESSRPARPHGTENMAQLSERAPAVVTHAPSVAAPANPGVSGVMLAVMAITVAVLGGGAVFVLGRSSDSPPPAAEQHEPVPAKAKVRPHTASQDEVSDAEVTTAPQASVTASVKADSSAVILKPTTSPPGRKAPVLRRPPRSPRGAGPFGKDIDL